MKDAADSTTLFQLLASRAQQNPNAPLYYRDGHAVSNREAHDDALALSNGLIALSSPSMGGECLRVLPRTVLRTRGNPSPHSPLSRPPLKQLALRPREHAEAPSAHPSPVIAVMFTDPYELHRLVWASRAAGCCLAFLPVVGDLDEVKALMDQVRAGYLITDLPSFWSENFVFSIDEISYTRPVQSHGSAKGPAFLLRTSGTMGSGKWVAVHDHHFLTILNAMRETGALRHAENQVAFLTPPLSHSYGLSSLLEYVHAGSAVVFPQGNSPLGPAGELREEGLAARITAIEGVPHFYGQLARLLRNMRLPALRHVGFGGGRLDREALTRLHSAYPEITCSVRYGLTETPSIVSGNVFHPTAEDDDSLGGRVLPPWEVRIVDEAGQPLPEGEEGEVQLRGPALAWPYYGEEAEEGAFFATGDLGVLQAGRLSIRGRKSLFIKHAGYRFSPEDVEAILGQFDGVLDTRVYLDGDTLTAEVVCDEGDLPAQALRDFAAARLPAYAVPKKLHPVVEIPRTESGKIKRAPASRKPKG